jgi:hypothetical protein
MKDDTMSTESAKIIATAIDHLADAITPRGACPGRDATGGSVGSLTEAMMGITAALQNISTELSSIRNEIECMREDDAAE